MSFGGKTNRQAAVSELVELACYINKRCESRVKPDGSTEEYSGFTVNLAGLEGAIGSPFQSFGGIPLLTSVYDIASSLLINVATGHHFKDGNKRTALLLCLAFLHRKGIKLAPPSAEEGAKLVENTVTNTKASYEERRIIVRDTLLRWAEIDETATRQRGDNEDGTD